ncbi:MAG: hypothetical protein FJ267_05030 [Planctomycetes bacterium]|nr:hypothetical protein [Planctomycetota bacterium]
MSGNRNRICLFVQMTQPVCRYVVVERGSPTPHLLVAGSFEVAEDRPLVDQVKEEIQSLNVKPRHAIALLLRTDIEISSIHLPPATPQELPDLVKNSAMLDADDSAGERVYDYLVTHQDEEACDALVFSAEEKRLEQLSADFKRAGFSLIGATFSGLGAMELLNHALQCPDRMAITVTVGDHELHVASQVNGVPNFFRSISWPTDDDRSIADKLAEEIPRIVAMAARGENLSPHVYLVGRESELDSIASPLSDSLSINTEILDPLNQFENLGKVDSPSRFASLLGIARAWGDQGLNLDLLNPHKSPSPPSATRRLALWGFVAASVLAAVGYLASNSQTDQIKEVEGLRAKHKLRSKKATQSLQHQATLDAINDWRSDEIVWLDELKELSDRLPQSDQALLRRLTLAVDSQRNGVVNLSVQVSKPEVVAQLEDALRDDRHSVSSKRVSEAEDRSDFPWGFETRIVFNSAGPPKLSSPGDSTEKNGESDTTEESNHEDSSDDVLPADETQPTERQERGDVE